MKKIILFLLLLLPCLSGCKIEFVFVQNSEPNTFVRPTSDPDNLDWRQIGRAHV